MSKRGKTDSGRDAGGFVALPWSVMDSPAYMGLSDKARSLLLEIARQFVRDNNGRLLASRAYLKRRGWTSASVIDRAKHELMDARLIFETVKGHRPNKASWYAVTWRSLDKHPDYDPGALAGFERGAYRTLELAPARPTREQCFQRWRKVFSKNAGLSPSDGTERAGIGPSAGTAKALPVPSAGPIEASSRGAPVPAAGHHLEKPSAEAPAEPLEEQPSPAAARTVRVREHELDPAMFDPTTGEHLPGESADSCQQRAEAQAWVERALQGRKRRA